MANCHGLPLRGGSLAGAFELLRRLPTEDALVLPSDDELQLLVSLLTEAVAA